MPQKWHSTRAYQWRREIVKIDWELLLALAVTVALVSLAALVLFVGISNATGCLSIDVPPQAVLYNHDGDTFAIFAFAPGGVVKVRVEGVNTPELKEPKGDLAKEFTRRWLAKGPFQLSTCGKSTLDRIVAKVSRNGRTLSQDLIDVGLSK